MTLVYAYQSRALTKDITILDANSGVITPGNSDNIRASIGHEGETPVFTVTSGTNTANGSSFTKNYTAGVNRLRIVEADLAFSPGTYTLFIDFQDGTDNGIYKVIDRQVFVLEAT